MKQVCPVCQRKFAHMGALHMHMRSHKSEELQRKPPEVATQMRFPVEELIQRLRDHLQRVDIAIRELEDLRAWMGNKPPQA